VNHFNIDHPEESVSAMDEKKAITTSDRITAVRVFGSLCCPIKTLHRPGGLEPLDAGGRLQPLFLTV